MHPPEHVIHSPEEHVSHDSFLSPHMGEHHNTLQSMPSIFSHTSADGTIRICLNSEGLLFRLSIAEIAGGVDTINGVVHRELSQSTIRNILGQYSLLYSRFEEAQTQYLREAGVPEDFLRIMGNSRSEPQLKAGSDLSTESTLGSMSDLSVRSKLEMSSQIRTSSTRGSSSSASLPLSVSANDALPMTEDSHARSPTGSTELDIDATVERSRQQLDTVLTTARALAHDTATALSEDGTVSVTINGTYQLVSIELVTGSTHTLNSRTYFSHHQGLYGSQKTPQCTGEAIVSAYHAAVSQLRNQNQQVLDNLEARLE